MTVQILSLVVWSIHDVAFTRFFGCFVLFYRRCYCLYFQQSLRLQNMQQWLQESYVCMKFVPVVLRMEVRLSHVLGNSYTTELSAQAWQCPMGNFWYRKSQQLHFSPGNRGVSSLATQTTVCHQCQKLLHRGVQEFLKPRLSPCDGALGEPDSSAQCTPGPHGPCSPGPVFTSLYQSVYIIFILQPL